MSYQVYNIWHNRLKTVNQYTGKEKEINMAKKEERFEVIFNIIYSKNSPSSTGGR